MAQYFGSKCDVYQTNTDLYGVDFSLLRFKHSATLKKNYKKCNNINHIFPNYHCVKRVRIRSYSGPYFPVFGLNTDQNNPKYEYFLCSVFFLAEYILFHIQKVKVKILIVLVLLLGTSCLLACEEFLSFFSWLSIFDDSFSIIKENTLQRLKEPL